MTTMPIARLVLNEAFYPRHSINAANMAQISEAILAGEEMPPVLVNRQTHEVVDGFHRVTAFERLYGAEYEIAVDLKTYRSKQAMLADAISLNVGRGADLTRWDHLRCQELAAEVGMPIDTLAKLLKWRPDHFADYTSRSMGTTIDGRKVALKRSLRHRLNKPITKAQEETNKHSDGKAALFHVNQIISLLQSDSMPEQEHVAAALNEMCKLVQAWLAEKGAYDGNE